MICVKQRNFEFSANFFRRYPDFCEKNVRCIVRGAYDTVNRNFTIVGGVHSLKKSPFSVKAKIFSIGYLLFGKKMYVVL